MLYLKRLQLIPFCDAACFQSKDKTWNPMLSYGADVLLDFHVVEFGIPLSLGVRYARLGTGFDANTNPNTFQFLFNFSL